MRYLLILSLLTLAGCATSPSDDALIAQATAAGEVARAEAKRLDTLSALAQGGGDGARVAGILAIMQPRAMVSQTPILSQRHWTDTLLGALGLAVQWRAIDAGRDISLRQSDNGAAISLGSYSAMTSLGGMIQAPQANISNVASGAGAATGGTAAWHNEQVGPDSPTSTTTTTTTTTTTDDHSGTATPTVVHPVVVSP